MLKRAVVFWTLLLAVLLPFDLSAQKGHSRSSTSRPSSRSSSSSAKSRTSKSTKQNTVPVRANARKESTVKKYSNRSSASTKITAPRATTRKSTVAARDSNGRIARSSSARKEFMRQTGYPSGRKGYVVDHRIPLECGGADIPSNMQWQTVQAAKIKDRTEARCRRE